MLFTTPPQALSIGTLGFFARKAAKNSAFLSLIRVLCFGQDLQHLYLAVAREQAEDIY